jgi:hypothetical protein
MISLEDCIGICGLAADEVDAIAEHEHIPPIMAAALADQLLHQPGGAERICRMIIDDIACAERAGQAEHAAQLMHALHRFVQEHPEAVHHA